MLRRQQAEAVVAARSRIVEGAVGMVDMALAMLNEKGIVELDKERKAAMVSNLLVVLCGEPRAQPVVNTGTLYSLTSWRNAKSFLLRISPELYEDARTLGSRRAPQRQCPDRVRARRRRATRQVGISRAPKAAGRASRW